MLYEDKFGDAAVGKVKCATGWDLDNEKQMKEVNRRVRAEEHGRTFDKLIELTRVPGRNLCYVLDQNELRSAKMDQNQGRFLGMCLVPKH